jgi:hypothetical protein
MVILKTIGGILRRPAYLAITLVTAFIVFTVAVVLIPSFSLVTSTLASSQIDLAGKVKIIASLYGAIGSNATVISRVIIITLSALVGINVALFSFVISRRFRNISKRAAGGSLGGLLSGLFGIGCAACGSLLLSAIFPTAAAAFLAGLPLEGQEIGLLGIALVGFSSYLLAKTVARPPNTCAI